MFWHQESVNYPPNTENPKCAEIQNPNPFVIQVEMMKPWINGLEDNKLISNK